MKIQEVKRILTRWQPSSFTLYREVFTQYGGSINMHPDIVDYFMKRHNWHFKFFHYKEDDKTKGAYFICNDQNIGILTRRTFPLSSDEILIPMAPDLRCFLPDRTNRLSAILHPAIPLITLPTFLVNCITFCLGIFFTLKGYPVHLISY